MSRVIIAGIGTGVGKTVVSAIMATMLQGKYWKPIQCGMQNSDAAEMEKLIGPAHIFPSSYSFETPVSPHYAANLEGISIDLEKIVPPNSDTPLIIEMVGGIFVPLTLTQLSVDLFHLWKARWVVVSKHYVGSINHTLLTLEALKSRNISILGIVFNGEACTATESAILSNSTVPILGRLFPEKNIDKSTIERYAKRWRV